METAATQKSYVSSKELCQELGISLPTLNIYRRKGMIPFFQPYGGGKCLYELDEVKKALRSYKATRKEDRA